MNYISNIADSCVHTENGRFYAKFHNSDNHRIDIKRHNEGMMIQLVKSNIDSEDEYTHEAKFGQNFFFKRSDFDKRLKASANGLTADIFEGCRFGAEEGRLIFVNISSGKILIE